MTEKIQKAKRDLWYFYFYDIKTPQKINELFDKLADLIGEDKAEDFFSDVEDYEDEFSHSYAKSCDYCSAKMSYIDVKRVGGGCTNEDCVENLDYDTFAKLYMA